MYKFLIFYKYCNYEKVIYVLYLENGFLWNIVFFNFSKYKLNIYKIKYIKIILILVGIEDI